MIQQLRRKLVCVIMTIVAILLCLIFCTLYQTARVSLEREMVSQMQLAAAGQAQFPCLILQLSADGQIVQAARTFTPLSSQDTEAEATDDWLSSPDFVWLQAVADAAQNTGLEDGLLVSEGIHFCWLNQPGQARRLLVLADANLELHILEQLMEGYLILGLISFFVFLLLSLLLSRWVIRPVERAWKQQRQFVADASHELKTPLTVILTNAQLLTDPAYSLAEKQRFSASILTMSQQMRKLTEHLLDLARVDNGIPKSGRAPVDWSKTVQDQALLFEPLYFEQGLTLETRIDEGITVLGSAPHLAQIPEILLDNARKYSTNGGTVVLRLVRSGSRHCLLSVSNPGPALSPETRKHLFERFYRADSARSRDGSYGLGLAIAHAAVTSHRGKIWASSEGGHNYFWVRLPLCRNKN